MQIIRSFLQRIPSSAVFLLAAALLILAFAWAVPAQAASTCFSASDSGRNACERTFAPLQTGALAPSAATRPGDLRPGCDSKIAIPR